tara:strand:+ start:148 stop:528 length:381 start_codon:yes stop_codon:yes gene_type:complete
MAKKKTEKQELDPPAWQSPVYIKALAKVKELEQIDREGKTATAFNSHKHVYVLKEGLQSGREFSMCTTYSCGRVKTWGDFPEGYNEDELRLTGHFFEGVNQAAGTTDLMSPIRGIRMPRYAEEDYD